MAVILCGVDPQLGEQRRRPVIAQRLLTLARADFDMVNGKVFRMGTISASILRNVSA